MVREDGPAHHLGVQQAAQGRQQAEGLRPRRHSSVQAAPLVHSVRPPFLITSSGSILLLRSYQRCSANRHAIFLRFTRDIGDQVEYRSDLPHKEALSVHARTIAEKWKALPAQEQEVRFPSTHGSRLRVPKLTRMCLISAIRLSTGTRWRRTSRSTPLRDRLRVSYSTSPDTVTFLRVPQTRNANLLHPGPAKTDVASTYFVHLETLVNPLPGPGCIILAMRKFPLQQTPVNQPWALGRCLPL